MRLKTNLLIVFFFVKLFGFSQTDTIRIDINQMSLKYSTCKCILFDGCRKYTYPVHSNWKKEDSLFIANKDSIYFIIKKNGLIKLEGHKQPKGEVFGEIKFYNNKSILTKIEIWEPVFLTRENESYYWADGYYWAKQMRYKKNELTKMSTRSIIYDENRGYAHKTEVCFFKNGKTKRTKIKIQYF